MGATCKSGSRRDSHKLLISGGWWLQMVPMAHILIKVRGD